MAEPVEPTLDEGAWEEFRTKRLHVVIACPLCDGELPTSGLEIEYRREDDVTAYRVQGQALREHLQTTHAANRRNHG